MEKKKVNVPKFSSAFVRSISDAMFFLQCSYCFSPCKDLSVVIRDCQKRINDCLDELTLVDRAIDEVIKNEKDS